MPLIKGTNWSELNNQQLNFAHFEIHRAYATFKRFDKYTDSEENSWSLEDFYNQHKLIWDEMKKRGMDVNEDDEMLKIGPRTQEFAPVRSSDEVLGEEIELEQVLHYFEDFRPVWPHVYLVGGLVNRNKTKNDIDILIKSQEDDPINIPIKFRILRMLPQELADRVQFLHVDTTDPHGHVPGPYTNHVPLFGMQMHAIKPFTTVEMQRSITVGRFFTPLKPTIGYKVGVVFGFDALAQLVDEELYPVIIQKKYDGARVQIHRKGDDVKIFSDDGKRIEHRLPSFVEEIKKDNWPSEIVIDAETEMWVRSKHQGREVTSGFLRKREKLFKGEDKDLIINVFDVLYLPEKGSLNKEPLSEREKLLKKLPIRQSTDRVPKTGVYNRTPSYEAKNDRDLVRISKKVTKLPGSEGAMVKSLKSPYDLDGQTNQWYKYKKTVEFVVIAVDKVETRTRGVFNYHMGIVPGDFEFTKSDERKVGNRNYMYVGKTMNSAIDVPKGTTLRVSAENVFLYKNRIRLYLPILLEAKPPDKVYNAKTTIEVAKEAGLLQEKAMQRTWPDEGEKHRFVIQLHFRGKSAHHDLRAQVNDSLEGWTIFSQPAGVVKEEPTTKAEAQRIDRAVSWKWPKTDIHAQAGPKAKQPVEWLKVEGKFEPGAVGATREKSGFMLRVDQGEVEFGARKTWFYEYFLHGAKYDGRLIFRFIPRRAMESEVEVQTLAHGGNGHYHTAKINKDGDGQTTIEKKHYHTIKNFEVQKVNDHTHELPWCEETKEDQVEEDLTLQREVGFWNTWLPEDKTPYVLSRGAVNEGWVPPQGVSALPKAMRDKVPDQYQYWKHASRAKRNEVRNELRKAIKLEFKIKQKYDDHHYLLEREEKFFLGTTKTCTFDEGQIATYACFASVVAVDMQRNTFVLQHHWWKGPAVIRGGPSVEHWDLFLLPEGEMFVMTNDPLKGDTNASLRKPYAKDFWKKGDDGPEPIKPGDPGNPTRDTPSWTQVVDKGEVNILENGNLFKRFNFKGKKVKGTYVAQREDANINLWKFGKAEMPGEKLQKLQKSLQAGQCIEQHKIHMSIAEFHLEGEKMYVTGSALSYGVWNGDWYSPQVLDDRPERVMGIPIGVGPHKDERNYGSVVDYEYDHENHTIKIVTEVTDRDKQLEIEEGKYVGFSVEITVLADETRHIIEKIVSYDRVCIVKDPACEVCTLDHFRRGS